MPIRSVFLSWLRGWGPRGLVLVAGLALFLLGLVAIGKMTRDSLRGRSRYTLVFTDIDCVPPPGQDRMNFLVEVRYLAEMPETLQLLDENLVRHLAEAFARHPWVDKVERVEIVAPSQIRATLIFRKPVLAVLSSKEEKDLPWLVDRQGTLLPNSAPRLDLPVLSFPGRPTGPAGTIWAEGTIAAAARTASFLQPYQDRLHVIRMETHVGTLVLKTTRGLSVTWGSAPGQEEPGEPRADQKVQRLLDLEMRNGGPDRSGAAVEVDLRRTDKTRH